MATPVVESFEHAVAGGVTAASVTVDKPTGVAVGDLLLLIVGNEDATAGASFPTRSGWTKQYESGSSVPDCKIGMYSRVADGTEAASETITWGTGADSGGAWYVRVSGVDDTTPVHLIGSPSLVANASSRSSPSITTTVDDCLVFAHQSYDGADGVLSVAGTGWPTSVPANQELKDGTLATEWSGAWVTRELATAGASNTCDWSSTLSDGWVCVQFAIAGGDAAPAALESSQTGVVTASGTLSRTAALAQDQDGVVTATGTLSRTAALSQSQTGVVSAAGLLSKGAAELASSQTGVVSAAGTLSRTAALAASQTGVVSAVGTLKRAAALSSSQTGTVTAAGVLTSGAAQLAANQTGIVTAAGTLSRTAALESAQTGSVAATGTLTAAAALASSQAGVVTAAGVLTAGATQLAADQMGVVSAAGVLTRAAGLAAAQTGVVAASGTLTRVAALTTNQAGVVTVAGVLTKVVDVVRIEGDNRLVGFTDAHAVTEFTAAHTAVLMED